MAVRTAIVLLLLATTACGRVREVRACRALGKLVNPALDDIAKRTDKDRSVGAYRYAARRYAALARDVAEFDLGIPRAEQAIDDLGAALKEAGVQTGKLADALEKQDNTLASNARRELGQLARLQNAIVARLEKDCLLD